MITERIFLVLVQELETVFDDKQDVFFYPAFLTGTSRPFSEKERLEFVKRMLSDIHDVNKITAGTKFYSLPRMHACMNDDPNFFSIDVFGNVCACEHQLGHPESAMGNLREGMEFFDLRKKGKTLRKECEECVFLPKCFGGCEANFLEDEIPCAIEKYLIQAYLALL